ncbi:unnamed protein product [Clavelina lepadiformis]|uniref:Uncharacterized protein n=1 Tax=Clavelina lepadiformis TaxID=159417 RepID=A0ABP0GUL0_CLALP
MIKRDGRGHSYCAARGEILGSAQDEQLRKHLPRMFSLIKSESQRCSGPHARYTDRISVCSPWPKGLGNPLNPGRARDRELQLFPLNEEFPVSVGEPAEGSLSKRTEAPARVAAASTGKPAASRACRGQDAPVEALDKAQVFHGRRVPSRFQVTVARSSARRSKIKPDTLSIDVLNANCGLGLIPGPRPPQGSSEKQSRCACRPGECGVGRRPVSPPSRRSQQGSGTRSESAAAADRPRRGVLVSPSRRDRSRTSSILGTCDVSYISA